MDGEPMYIQMVTALVLQLIQCVVHLPSSEKDSNSEEDSNKKVSTYSQKLYLEVVIAIISIFNKLGEKKVIDTYG